MTKSTEPFSNQSGLTPLGWAVLTLPVPIKSVIAIPPTVKARTAMIDSEVMVIAVGPDAWKDQTARAKPGDIVLVTNMAGYMAMGKDDQLYRIVNDADIFCRKDF